MREQIEDGAQERCDDERDARKMTTGISAKRKSERYCDTTCCHAASAMLRAILRVAER